MSNWLLAFDLIDFNYLRFMTKGTSTVVSRTKKISLPPVKDTFTKVVSKNNSQRKSFMRSIITRR
ncbi:MAG: hypothetical protein MJ180_06025 [Candidatus Gastranaerophilales bacterium]|nr:hypothetical protein [Candidatus Gastranaerophilales bacterium]